MSQKTNKKQTALNNRYIRLGLFLLLGVLLYVSTFNNVVPEQLDISLSEPAPQDIRSPITIEHEEQTAERRREAVATIDPVYTLQTHYATTQTDKVNAIFDLAITLQSEMEEESEEADEPPSTDEQVEYMQEALSENVDQSISSATIETLLTSSSQELRTARDVARNAIFEVMNDGISVDQVPTAREEAEERVSRSITSSRMQSAVSEITTSLVTANYIYDDEATNEQVELAVSEVDPVLIREGQLLAQEGEVIGPEAYEQMRLVGLLDDSTSLYPYIGLLIFVGLLLLLLQLYMMQTSAPIHNSNKYLLLYVIVFVVMLVIMNLQSLIIQFDLTGVMWLTPMALGPMLLAQMIDYRVALFSATLFAITGSIIFSHAAASSFHSSFLIYAILSGFAGVFFIGKQPRISKVLQAGIFVALINGLAVTLLHMLNNQQVVFQTYGNEVSFAVLSGFLSAILSLGLLRFLKQGFNILSKTKLIELTNANQPLLRKILLEAPGTYHHSVMVANLSEAASEAIGANGLLARVGAYYHDLGKTKNPMYFIENQMQIENPHDRLPPERSKQIIIDHPYDGAAILEKHNFPKEIVDIAKEHHGTTLLKFFYYKAKEQGKEPVESEYRYPGPRAQFKESAIIGIADSVEAAVRSMPNPTEEKIRNLVDAIIRDRLVDQQFNECDITLKELATVADSMCETLKGTFHSRIEYPDDEQGEVKENE
ncbi:LOW QUALITY PROTEIN: membrane protein [Geomicrobium sp. JCM 19038]|nr:LOW QUALITY PROTEIN: membrane protein [Geomicrobium sp. JCM 19038]